MHVGGEWEGFRFMKKLQGIKKKLLIWNKECFGRVEIKKSEIWKDIQAIDK